MRVRLSVFTLAIAMSLIQSVSAQSVAVPLTPDRWIISQRNFKLTQEEDFSHNGELAEFLGRPALRVSRGLFYAKDVEFEDGTIDVDVATSSGRFIGLAFRVKSD